MEKVLKNLTIEEISRSKYIGVKRKEFPPKLIKNALIDSEFSMFVEKEKSYSREIGFPLPFEHKSFIKVSEYYMIVFVIQLPF